MPQFLINSKDISDSKITISDKENYTHIAKSLRIKKGEKLLLIDENQMRYETVVEEVTNKEIKVYVENSYKSARRLDFGLYLAQVPLRSDAQSIIIEKATELGADGIYPIFSDNCAVSRTVIEKKIPKWQKIMYEAFKQCERAYVPKCFDLINFEEIIKLKNEYKIIAFCERNCQMTFHEYFNNNPILNKDKLLVIIGPEGGFSKKEFDYLKSNSIPMLTLGDLILKAETATIVALGNIIYEYNNSKKN